MKKTFVRIILTLSLTYILAIMVFILGDIFIWELSRYTRTLLVLIFSVIPFILYGMTLASRHIPGVGWTEQDELFAQKISFLTRIGTILSVGYFVYVLSF